MYEGFEEDAYSDTSTTVGDDTLAGEMDSI